MFLFRDPDKVSFHIDWENRTGRANIFRVGIAVASAALMLKSFEVYTLYQKVQQKRSNKLLTPKVDQNDRVYTLEEKIALAKVIGTRIGSNNVKSTKRTYDDAKNVKVPVDVILESVVKFIQNVPKETFLHDGNGDDILKILFFTHCSNSWNKWKSDLQESKKLKPFEILEDCKVMLDHFDAVKWNWFNKPVAAENSLLKMVDYLTLLKSQLTEKQFKGTSFTTSKEALDVYGYSTIYKPIVTRDVSTDSTDKVILEDKKEDEFQIIS